MELTKKTTILLSPALHSRLVTVAARRRVSLGHLVREACEREYGDSSLEERLAAWRMLTSIGAPVADVATMKRESIDDSKPSL